jgi:Ca2+-binding RTX toxin-like protein
VAGFTFSGFENLTGGASDDVYTFANGAGVAGAIDGGGGANTLDYAAFTTNLTVNLTTGAATATGSVSNIQHVFGGAGNDSFTGSAVANVLVGNTGNDSVFGNDGRDVLIGGLGGDSLDGGNDDDILIGARTSYDASIASMLAILSEWTRTDLSYAARLSHISGATTGGLNGTFRLNSTTVFDDNRTPDTLFGRAGTDWFIYGTRDDVADSISGETTTKI